MEIHNPLLIVVDPGHGGYDNGAMYQGRLEKDDNLRLGLAVRDALMYQGVDVLMTRDTDVFVSLTDRVDLANQKDADLFVSLHRDSYPEQTPFSNGVENFIYLTAPEATTGKAARLVLDAVVDVGVQSSRGVTRGNYYVLRRTRMPAMLLEMGFIINEIDNRLFDEHLYEYAEAIAKGIMKYFGLTYVPPTADTMPEAPVPDPIPFIEIMPPVNPIPSISTLPLVETVPPIDTLPPAEPVPPIGTLPLVEPVPPIGTLPLVEPVPPIGTSPSAEPVPPIGTLPLVEPVPPIGTSPSAEPVPPIDTSSSAEPVPPVKPDPPIRTLPPVKPTPQIGTLPPNRTDLVISAQRALNISFSANLSLDGGYGPRTKSAVVRTLQRLINESRNKNISVDGVYGPKTRSLLPTLRQGSQGDMVQVLQILLHLKGYDSGAINGDFNSRTKAALSMYQRDNFLIPDGVAGPRTLNHLLS